MLQERDTHIDAWMQTTLYPLFISQGSYENNDACHPLPYSWTKWLICNAIVGTVFQYLGPVHDVLYSQSSKYPWDPLSGDRITLWS